MRVDDENEEVTQLPGNERIKGEGWKMRVMSMALKLSPES